MTDLIRLPHTTTAADIIAALERDGGVIIEGFLAPETLAELRTDLRPFLESQSTGRDEFSGDKTRRLSRLFARTRHCAEIVTHPLYLPVAEHFISKPFEIWNGAGRRSLAAGIRIGATQAIQIGPGQSAQVLHRDDSAFLWRHPTNGREGRVQIMVAISDFTTANGGTLVIPGSHLWGEDRQPMISEAIPTVMTAGSALIWLGSVFHAGGENRSESESRTGLTIALDASNVRQEENMYLSLTPEVVASYAEQIQRLLGWSAGPTAMGWVEVDGQMVDPINLLRDVDVKNLTAVTGRRE
jgi:ectoine hydroxylase-related dioxygenase (phytanoyl-CoA dioxygenase family)